jgi:hypothetical protein
MSPGASAIGRIVLLGLVASQGACERRPPLAPELKAFHCPTNRQEHASATFGKARITFVCISKALADSPYLLKCDLESRPMICEDDGSLMFSRSAAGEVYVGSLPAHLRQQDASASEVPGGSQLIVNFRKAPPRTSTFDEVETDWRFLLPEGKDLLPRGFTFVKGTLCDRAATVLNSGVCNLEAKSASLYWHIAVSISAERGTAVSAEEYRAEIAFWLGLLEKLVTDPAK